MHLDESHRLIKAIRNDNSDIIGIKKDLNEEGKSFWLYQIVMSLVRITAQPLQIK